MKYSHLEWIEEVLVLFMNHLILATGIMTIYGMNKPDGTHLLLWMSLIVVPFFLYMLRVKVQKIWLFFFLHVIVPVIIFLLPLSLSLRIHMIVVAVIYMILSIRIKLMNESEVDVMFHPVLFIGLLCCMILFENLYIINGWEFYYLLAALLYFISFFICYFIQKYQMFLEISECNSTNIPEQEIFNSGFKQTLMFVGVGLVPIIVSACFEWFSKLVSVVWRCFVAFLKFLGSFFPKAHQDEMEEPMQEQASEFIDEFVETGETAWFWEIIDKLFKVVMIVGLLLIAFLILRQIYRFICEHFQTKVGQNSSVLNNGDLREHCGIETIRSKRGESFNLWDYRKRIQKLYRKRVLKGKAEIIGNKDSKALEYMTAKECCDILSEHSLKEMYEKARYSLEKITAEDVKRARKDIV